MFIWWLLTILGWLMVLAVYLLGIVYFLSEWIAVRGPEREWSWRVTRDLLWWPALMVAGIKENRAAVKRALAR